MPGQSKVMFSVQAPVAVDEGESVSAIDGIVICYYTINDLCRSMLSHIKYTDLY
jgi:hypothetical protein